MIIKTLTFKHLPSSSSLRPVVKSAFMQRLGYQTLLLCITGFDDPSIKPMEAAKAAHQWCTSFQAFIDKKDIDAIVEAFTEDGWWRDMLTFAFDFNSFKSESF